MYTHILIATDGSELAEKGIAHGLALAASLGAKATVATVSEPMSEGYADITGWSTVGGIAADYQRAVEQRAAETLAAAQKLAEQAGVGISVLHVRGHRPADGIIDAARRQDCDLIVMASHGRRGLGRLLLGSQTQEVLVHGNVPVLVIR